MATRRIKEITNTATTFASDDFIALDGTSQGTRKMDKDDLISQVSAGVSGDYLEEANNLSDVASLDTSKLNLEVPDVGTAPNEVPLNGQLGSMAYQSADSVSMARAEIESTTGTATTEAFKVTDGTDTNLVVREDGKVGLGGTPTVQLEVFNDSSAIARLSAGTNASASLRLKNDAHEWDVNCQTNDNFAIYSHTSAAERLVVNASSGDVTIGQGNIVMGTSGKGIDFGSTNTTAGVTVTGSTLDHYEEGSWTVTTSGDATGVIGASSATYTRIGNIVTIRAVFTVTSNFTGNKIGGLPYQPADNSVSSYTGATLAMNVNTSSSPIVAYVLGSNDTVHFSTGTNIGSTHAPNTTNASYRVSLSYNV